MLNEKTRLALQKGEYVTCGCFQEMAAEAREMFSVNNVPPKLACPVSQVLGRSTLPYFRYIPEKKRYSTRTNGEITVTRKWTHCPFCGKPLREATEQDQMFFRK